MYDLKFARNRFFALAFAVAVCAPTSAVSQERVAVHLRRLGGRRTSFSRTLSTQADLKQLILSRATEVQRVLALANVGWGGTVDDIRTGASVGTLGTTELPVGSRIPWMAVRRHREPAILSPSDGLVWDGPAPLAAYTLTFRFRDQEWTLIAPRACGNFWTSVKDIPPNCTPTTCAHEGARCGPMSDGCGNVLDCGKCSIADCFHENDEIRFAPDGSPYGRRGLIMHDDGFGDTAQREGWYWFGVWLRQNVIGDPWIDDPPRELSFDDVLRKLEPNTDGVFVRAPGLDPFGRLSDGLDKHGTTRDQLVPLIAAMSVWGKTEQLQRLWTALPEDVDGKHDFQGHWLDLTKNETFFTSDPCNDIKNRNCKAKEDIRDCGRSGVCGSDLCPCAERGCSSSCETQNCTRPCIFDVCGDEICVKGLDLDCEGKKIDCERLKGQENAACKSAELACETLKAAQNALYWGEARTCELQRQADVGYCYAKKEAGLLRFVGVDYPIDPPLPPATYNLLIRAGVVPVSLFPATLKAISPPGLLIGEGWLKSAVDVYRHQAAADLDHVDQDMNFLVMLIMSRLKLSTPISESAISSYASRAHSMGSYFGQYCATYGLLRYYTECPTWEPDCCKDKQCVDDRLKDRIKRGIASGWVPDGPGIGPYGAVRWYNRWSTKANPKLATLYAPIIEWLLRGK